MFRVSVLALLSLLWACGSSEPPPGELIGTFAFRATLEPQSERSCPYPESPERLDFEGILSWDPGTGAVWLSIGNRAREGLLDGNRFEAALPADSVPRKLRSCGCEMTFRERFQGMLVTDPALSCLDASAPVLAVPVEALEISPEDNGIERFTCPGTTEDGAVDWGGCGGLCGTMIEAVAAPSGCVCELPGGPIAAPAQCEIRYKLRATRVGGRS